LKPFACLLFATWYISAAPSHAAEIYRWVDSDGHTHVSDTLPDRYRASAKKIDTNQYELSANQKRELATRKAVPTATASASSSTPASAPNSTSIGGAVPASRQLTEREQCQEKINAYQAAEDCFAPYKMKNGGTKAEAFQLCPVLVRPTCGP
jgi:Ribonuclease G/E